MRQAIIIDKYRNILDFGSADILKEDIAPAGDTQIIRLPRRMRVIRNSPKRVSPILWKCRVQYGWTLPAEKSESTMNL